ncbi:type II CRISPR-associated endonuclease Cas1 [Listeria fleischmannii]|uniref:CRISPR-associated endonuclease Cas1 n=1 Tax=Listeria fleischmannii TaxID=1069827 RepID=A0A841YGK6_9LIST|nr:type II CRISPR-associated endonuclease Cas1 [Listeria fleischmannii]EIA19423.1 CRISPR-associated protein Cas1 [Listeria fleischmannii subsp. coloradonensis]MBC1399525.1 type II CRISPR-associated endonuclease Cas1 [Listeria fleischmannii]MBC1428211.1 type II CRISPR-associated endonuclease Cas1 [Listeria fleischmannii]STY34193.1 CRISPR-associated endonuclease Cas1, subtype II/NMENI [Listeria fleischmannii subsp. coloradonensis]
MTWRTVLVKDSEYIKLKLDSIVILKEEYEYVIPLSDISIIVLEGLQTTVTTRLLSALTRYNISLVICDHTYTPTGIYHSYNGHSRASKMIQAQIAWEEKMKGEFWRNNIKQKIYGQAQVLSLVKPDIEAIQKLENYITEIDHYDKSNREGHAAKVYFNALFGKEFSRQDDELPINAGLNYGYSIFRAQIARLVVAYGLQPMLGVFHRSEYNQFNLVDDLIEPFRPFVDVWVYANMRKEKFLTFEHRAALINLLNLRSKYKNGHYTLLVIMEKYIQDFISYMETGDLSKINMIDMTSFEGASKSEV